MVAMMPFHAEKCWHQVSTHTPTLDWVHKWERLSIGALVLTGRMHFQPTATSLGTNATCNMHY